MARYKRITLAWADEFRRIRRKRSIKTHYAVVKEFTKYIKDQEERINRDFRMRETFIRKCGQFEGEAMFWKWKQEQKQKESKHLNI